MKVKICGITRVEDALVAADAGADAVGFIFSRSSPRYIEPERAAEIIRKLPRHTTPVGVFVNAPRKEINAVITQSGIRCIQLHGEETAAETRDFSIPVMKAFRVGAGFDSAVLSGYAVAGYLLDTYDPVKRGGTGKAFDWAIARAAKPAGRIIVSGGLNPDNILEAVKLVGPYAVDVNSGVEKSPGIKDGEKIARLFHVVHAYHAISEQEFLC